MKRWLAGALAAAGFLCLLVLMAGFGAASSISQAAAACGIPAATDLPAGGNAAQRDAGGGVFVGGKWHYREDGGPTWTASRIANVAAQYGLPGKQFAQIARGESNYHPYVVQHDPGDGNVGFGFFQFTPNAWGGKTSATYRKYQSLGGQKGLENIAKQFELARWMYIAAGHSISPWHGTGFVTDWATPKAGPVTGNRVLAADDPIACVSEEAVSAVEGSPKDIIDRIVLPLAAKCGIKRTVAENDAANARHGATVNGGLSDHQGPPDQRWAADTSNGTSPTPEMDCHAKKVAERFNIPWTGSGAVSHNEGQYRIQLIYKSMTGGNHFNHTHVGVAMIAGPF